MVRCVLVVVALLATLGVVGAQERGRHGGVLPAEGGAGNGGMRQTPPFDGRTGVFEQSQRHCFSQDRQGRRVRVPC